MQARNKTLIVLNRHLQALDSSQFRKVAGFKGEVVNEIPKKAKTRGIDNEVGGHLKRVIPKGYVYDPKAIKPLAKMLWAMSVSLGHALTAHRQFTKLKSSTISPDGLIGGRGYVMAVKDVRKLLYDACEGLSAVSDTIHDELHASHWKPQLAEMEKNDVEDIERLVGDAERMLEDPEDEIEDDMEEAAEEGPKAKLEKGEGDPKSKLPGSSGGLVDSYVESRHRTKQASQYIYRRANSSEPVETLPGPRVQHLDRGDVDQTGPFGSYNSEEPKSVKDEWSKDEGVGNDYPYQSEWDNELLDKTSGSHLPGTLTDKTPTEADDFGLGYGEGNDAHGQGTGGYGTVDSNGRGVYGPYAELPSDPGGKLHDDVSDTTPIVEVEVGRSSMPRQAAMPFNTPAKSKRTLLTDERTVKTLIKSVGDVQIRSGHTPPIILVEPFDDGKCQGRPVLFDTSVVRLHSSYARHGSPRSSVLPNDVLRSVARSDYYYGDKGDNEVNAEAELPGVPENDYEFSKDVQPGTGYRYEQGYQPYVKWDSDTHNMKFDYVYQRDMEGPYEREA